MVKSFGFSFFDSNSFPLCARADRSYLCEIAKMNKICGSNGSDEYVNGQQILKKENHIVCQSNLIMVFIVT